MTKDMTRHEQPNEGFKNLANIMNGSYTPDPDFAYMADNTQDMSVEHFIPWVSRERLDEKLRELISILAAAKELQQMISVYDPSIYAKYEIEALRPIVTLCITDALWIAMALQPIKKDEQLKHCKEGE